MAATMFAAWALKPPMLPAIAEPTRFLLMFSSTRAPVLVFKTCRVTWAQRESFSSPWRKKNLLSSVSLSPLWPLEQEWTLHTRWIFLCRGSSWQRLVSYPCSSFHWRLTHACRDTSHRFETELVLCPAERHTRHSLHNSLFKHFSNT